MLLVLYVQAKGQDKCELPVPLIRSAHQHLVAAREEAARTAKELAELKASRVQHIPPSTWIKREQKYKMDQEKYEHIIGQLRQRSEALERELAVLREGSNVRPLEEKIQVGAVGLAAVQTDTAAGRDCCWRAGQRCSAGTSDNYSSLPKHKALVAQRMNVHALLTLWSCRSLSTSLLLQLRRRQRCRASSMNSPSSTGSS